MPIETPTQTKNNTNTYKTTSKTNMVILTATTPTALQETITPPSCRPPPTKDSDAQCNTPKNHNQSSPTDAQKQMRLSQGKQHQKECKRFRLCFFKTPTPTTKPRPLIGTLNQDLQLCQTNCC
jgi:hypothetical protein